MYTSMLPSVQLVVSDQEYRQMPAQGLIRTANPGGRIDTDAMSTRYAYVGPVSGELLSFRGRVLVHDNPGEMQFLMPAMRVVELPKADLERPLMRLRDHPDLAALTWPLRKEDFR